MEKMMDRKLSLIRGLAHCIEILSTDVQYPHAQLATEEHIEELRLAVLKFHKQAIEGKR